MQEGDVVESHQAIVNNNNNIVVADGELHPESLNAA